MLRIVTTRVGIAIVSNLQSAANWQLPWSWFYASLTLHGKVGFQFVGQICIIAPYSLALAASLYSCS